MDLTEKTLSSEKIYDGAIIHVRRDRVLQIGRAHV